jgi:hypothetical protein
MRLDTALISDWAVRDEHGAAPADGFRKHAHRCFNERMAVSDFGNGPYIEEHASLTPAELKVVPNADYAVLPKWRAH